jgi:hypothetical protein
VAVDGFAAGGDSGIADAAIFIEGAFGLDGLDAELRAILFEEEFIAGANTHGTANGVRYRDLALARDASLFLESGFRHSLLYHESPYFGRGTAARQGATRPSASSCAVGGDLGGADTEERSFAPLRMTAKRQRRRTSVARTLP